MHMIIRDWKKDLFTIPNMLSLFRLLLIPVYVVIYLNADSARDYCLAAGILAVSCLTDAIDGKIARKFHMISTIGKFLDPVADKATQFTLILCQAADRPILWMLISLFVIKEGFQLIAGGLRLRKGIMLKGALLSGKICTTVLFVSLIILVLMPNLNSQIVLWITIVDTIFMLISFADYLMAYHGNDSKFQAIDLSNNINKDPE